MINAKGYRLIYLPDHPLAQKRGWVLEQRRVWYDVHGEIPAGFVVHHRNHIKTDNRIENLMLLSRADHAVEHSATTTPLLGEHRHIGTDALREHNAINGPWNQGTAEVGELICHICGHRFPRRASEARHTLRRGRVACCSRSCRAVRANQARHAKAAGKEVK